MYKTAEFLKDIMLIWLDEKNHEEMTPFQVLISMETTISIAFQMGLITRYQANLANEFNDLLMNVFSEPSDDENGDPPFGEDE